jgi:TorA maturation chaperone TorD
MNSCDEELRQYFDAYLNVRSQLNEPDRRVQLETEYNRLFAHLGSAVCPPYETEFGYENVFQKTEAMADIAGFYTAYGLAPSEADTERVDFISIELEFMSYLAVHEAYARDHNEHEHLDVCVDTQKKFLRDHLGRWVSLFVRILSNSSSQPFYSWLGSFTDYFVNYEARCHNVILDKIANRPMMKSLMPEPFDCDGCAAYEIATTK